MQVKLLMYHHAYLRDFDITSDSVPLVVDDEFWFGPCKLSIRRHIAKMFKFQNCTLLSVPKYIRIFLVGIAPAKLSQDYRIISYIGEVKYLLSFKQVYNEVCNRDVCSISLMSNKMIGRLKYLLDNKKNEECPLHVEPVYKFSGYRHIPNTIHSGDKWIKDLAPYSGYYMVDDVLVSPRGFSADCTFYGIIHYAIRGKGNVMKINRDHARILKKACNDETISTTKPFGKLENMPGVHLTLHNQDAVDFLRLCHCMFKPHN